MSKLVTLDVALNSKSVHSARGGPHPSGHEPKVRDRSQVSFAKHMQRLANDHAEGERDTHRGKNARQRGTTTHAWVLAAQGVSCNLSRKWACPTLMLHSCRALHSRSVLGPTLSSALVLVTGRAAELHCLSRHTSNKRRHQPRLRLTAGSSQQALHRISCLVQLLRARMRATRALTELCWASSHTCCPDAMSNQRKIIKMLPPLPQQSVMVPTAGLAAA